jgi:hypothetical protein
MVVPRRNRRAVSAVIGSLRKGGLLERSDEGVCTLARCSADALDDALAYGEKLYAVSSMMRTHLQILEALVGRAAAGADDGMGEVLSWLRNMPLGDADETGGYRLDGQLPPGER